MKCLFLRKMCRKYFKEFKKYKNNILSLFNDPDLVNLGIKEKLTMSLFVVFIFFPFLSFFFFTVVVFVIH